MDIKILTSMTSISESERDCFVIFVDAEDNGIDLGVQHMMSFISSYLPEWYKNEPNFESQFAKVLDTTITVLEQKIRQVISELYAKTLIRERSTSSTYFSNHILEIPSQTIPWLDTIVTLISNMLLKIKLLL